MDSCASGLLTGNGLLFIDINLQTGVLKYNPQAKFSYYYYSNYRINTLLRFAMHGSKHWVVTQEQLQSEIMFWEKGFRLRASVYIILTHKFQHTYNNYIQ